MSSHISKQCASAFYHLHNISRICKFLSTDTTKALVHVFVISHVDYCNSLLYGLPACNLNKVQRVLNAAARLVCRAPRYCRIMPFLYKLHCLTHFYHDNYQYLDICYYYYYYLVKTPTEELLVHVQQNRSDIKISLNSAVSFLIQQCCLGTHGTINMY